MTTTSTVLHIKEATLALSRTVPCANITVSMVIQKVNIARSTFYKYFQNMTKVWHAITHDLMCSISTQLDQLYISSMHHFNDIHRQKILTFAELSPLSDLLSYGLVDKCFLAIQRGDKQMLFDYYLASNKILHALCDQKKLLEQMTKHVSGI